MLITLRLIELVFAERRGVTALEFAFIGGVVAMVMVVGARLVGTSLSSDFVHVAGSV